MRRFIILTFVLCLVACAPVDEGNNGDDGIIEIAATFESKAPPTPTATALERPGDVGDEETLIMVNGRAITPAGEMRATNAFPADTLQLPDGNLVVLTLRGGNHGFTIYDGLTFDVLAVENLSSPFHGIAANAAGDRLWVAAGNQQKVAEYTLAGGVPTLVRDIPSMLIPAGLVVTPDEQKLLVTSSFGSGVQIIDLADGSLQTIAPTGLYPFEIILSAAGGEAYVSNWGGSTVTVIDVQQAAGIAEIDVGLHPEGMVLAADGGTLYVANADSDTISVVDLATREEVDVLDVYNAEEVVGASPIDVALSADGSRLYAACAGLNAVAVFDTDAGERLGFIPAGYYPTDVEVDDARDVLYITNGKGGGIPTDEASWGVTQVGTIQKVAIPTPAELADYSQQVIDNLTRSELFWETMSFDSPIPTERGVPSEQIKRVVFIMKENKTYDQVFGDMVGTERDESLLVFGEDVTPNIHRLAHQFTSCDSYYSEADASVQGHMWSVLMYANDYMEKGRAMGSSRYSMTNMEPASSSGKGSIFRHLYDNDIGFRVYGQVLALGDMPDLLPYVNMKYGFWNLGISDETKADEVIREMEADIWPEFVYISLPNDHADGSSEGVPTIPYYVGDNDAGLGKLIEYITHSQYWHETAIIVTQDDPQSGADHVDPHRTIALVISPYAKRGYTSSVLYSMPSIWMTIEMIFGLPPLTVYDRHTSPMYDCFTEEADPDTYDAVPNPIPLEYNPSGLALAEYSSKQQWDAPDQVPRLGEIVWAYMRPGEPWPAEYSVDSYWRDNDDEGEEDDAEQYRAAVSLIKAQAVKRGLWDGSSLPTIEQLVEQGVVRVGQTRK